MFRRPGMVIAVLIASAGHVAARSATDPGREAVQCGHLVATETGKLLGPTTIVVAGERIQELQAGIHGVPGAQSIDLSHMTCMPGLIDSHTHLSIEYGPTFFTDDFHWNLGDYAVRSTVYARRTLLAGFTTVRNVGDVANEIVSLRNAINAGIVPGPRIFTAGVPIGSTGGHADPTDGYRTDLAGDPGPAQGIINSVADAAKAVRLHYKNNDDLIKIMPSGGVMDQSLSEENPQLTLEEITAVVAAAHDYGFTVAAHAHGAEAIRRAVLGGVDSIEHGTYMSEEDMKLMRERGTWYVPTISAGDAVVENARIPGFYPPLIAAKALAIGPQILKTTARAHRAGVKIAYGTDASVFPHGQNGREFELLVRAGLSPMAALQAATVNSARLLRKEDSLGSIEAGKFADIVATDGNPLDDIRQMMKIRYVMKGGITYERDGVAVNLDPIRAE